MKRVVTHGTKRFHADDVFAVATLDLLYDGDISVERTQDEEKIQQADIVVDVGGVYDPDVNRFDHHQKGGAGARENGIEYASIGLVWMKFGVELCGSQEVADYIDRRLIQPVDAWDNGIMVYDLKKEDVEPVVLQNILQLYQSTWKEDGNADEQFMEAVDLAKFILKRSIKKAQDHYEAREQIIDIYHKSEDKRVIIFDADSTFFDEDRIATLAQFKEVLFMVRPDPERNMWRVKAMKKYKTGFENRKDLPESWGGLYSEALQKVSGVADAQFCHRALFTCSATSKEGALEMVKKALEE